MKLKALIFDVDGTLADTEETHRQAFNQAFVRHGLGWHWSREKYAELLSITGGKERIALHADAVIAGRFARAEFEQRVAGIHATKTDIYTALVEAGAAPLRDGVRQVLDEAAGNGVQLAIASTTTRSNIDTLLCTSLGRGAMQRFRVVASGDEVARKKPAPDVYEFVLAQLRRTPGECAAIEDSSNGLRAAKAAGLYTVVTPSFWTRLEDFSAADRVMPSLAQLRVHDLDHTFAAITQHQ